MSSKRLQAFNEESLIEVIHSLTGSIFFKYKLYSQSGSVNNSILKAGDSGSKCSVEPFQVSTA